jgi:hypothetical protein
MDLPEEALSVLLFLEQFFKLSKLDTKAIESVSYKLFVREAYMSRLCQPIFLIISNIKMSIWISLFET